MEIWKELSFTNDKYSVSNFGRVRNNENDYIFKCQDNGRGYLKAQFVCLGKKNKYVHRLVAEHFIDNPNNYKEVNHIDGVKYNNHYTNLEWCNRSQNLIHASRNDLKNPIVPEKNRLEIISRFNTGDSATVLSKEYNTCKTNIYRIIKSNNLKNRDNQQPSLN
jgi:hypothetical protein